jgi:hypothetical protein
VLVVEIESLKARVEETSLELMAAKQRVLVSSDNTSSEIQVLEEENIELLAENKDLRAKLAKARIAGPVTAAPVAVTSAPAPAPVASENVAPHSPTPVTVQKKQSTGTPSVGQKRAFGTDVTNTMSAKKSSVVESKVTKPVSLSALVTGSDVDATQGRKKVAKPIVAAADESAAECTQS